MLESSLEKNMEPSTASQVGAVIKRLQAADNADALQLLQTEIATLARDASFNLRIVAAAAAHSAASAGLLQFFKDHCLSCLLVLKADKVQASSECCVMCLLVSRVWLPCSYACACACACACA